MATALLAAASVTKHLLCIIRTCGIWSQKYNNKNNTRISEMLYTILCRCLFFTLVIFLYFFFFVFFSLTLLCVSFRPSLARMFIYFHYRQFLCVCLHFSFDIRLFTLMFLLCSVANLSYVGVRRGLLMFSLLYIPLYLLCLLLFTWF